jgi:hypothetical protein
MTKVIRFLTTCLQVVSLAAVTFADGGETHGPGLTPPQPTATESTTGCTGNPSCPVPDPSVDASEVANVIVTCLLQAVL